MRQGNGSDLLGLKDPRSTKIGIIYVASNDDRKSVLAAILTQEKLGREQIAIVLPENQSSKAFQHPQDFDDLRTIRRKLRAQLIFIAPSGPGPAEFARQRRFSVYSSLESYVDALRTESLFIGTRNKGKKGQLFGLSRKTAPLGRAAVGGTDLTNESVQQPIASDVSAAVSMDDDWDALPPVPSASSLQRNVSAASSALNATPPPPPSSMPNTPDPTGGAGPDIIELSLPVPQTASRRSTVKLPAVGENAAATSAVPSSVTPLPRTPDQPSNTGKTAAVTSAAAPALSSHGVSAMRSSMRSSKATQTKTRRRKRSLGGLIVVFLVIALLLLCSGVASLQLFQMPLVGSSAPATITIMPDSRVEQDSYVIQAVTGSADPAKRQVPLRQLTFSPPNQSKLVTATGVGHVSAKAATGQLTFYNGSNQDFVVGSTTAIPGPNGVSVETDGPADIPAAHLPTVGSLTVNAHVATAGASGNMAAGAINETCCASGGFITVVSSAFTGGQDEQDYTFLQQSDVDSYVDQLNPTLSQQALNGLKAQIKKNEQLADDPQCTTQSTEDQSVGDQGRNVTSANVTVNATCTGLAYDASGAQVLAQNLLKKKASNSLGQAYALAGTMNTKSTVTDVKDGVVTLQVTASGTWYYQFNDKQKQTLANQLANKTRIAAQGFLNASKGIGKAKIDIANGGDSLPDDSGQIRIIVVAASGASPTNQPA